MRMRPVRLVRPVQLEKGTRRPLPETLAVALPTATGVLRGGSAPMPGNNGYHWHHRHRMNPQPQRRLPKRQLLRH